MSRSFFEQIEIKKPIMAFLLDKMWDIIYNRVCVCVSDQKGIPVLFVDRSKGKDHDCGRKAF